MSPTVGVLLAALLLAGCGGADRAPSKGSEDGGDRQEGAAVEPAASVLVVRGRSSVSDDPSATLPVRSPRGRPDVAAPLSPPRRLALDREPWPAPPLLTDGTLDAGRDPFEGQAVPVQPIPIEDDPGATAEISQAAMELRRIDVERWREWMDGDGESPWQQPRVPSGPAMAPITKVFVERCGGARTVATGVVLDEETVVTTVHAIESAASRVRVGPVTGGRRLPAMVRYLDVDDDVAVLKVPGLTTEPMRWYVPVDEAPRLAYAYGVVAGGRSGTLRRAPVLASTRETTIDVEQPDGFARRISDRPVQTVVGGISGGFSGGVVSMTNDPLLRTGFGFHGLVRARVPFRADTAGVVVPSRVVAAALDAAERVEEWFEHPPGGCPQWRRPPRVGH